jgi:hypothetical protein
VTDPKPTPPKTIEPPPETDQQPVAEEVRLYEAHWPELLREMNRLLAQEEQ